MSLIGVTGASGKLGSAIVAELLTLVPPSTVVAIARDPVKLAALGAQGAQVRRGDFGQPETLAGAFEGLDKLVLVSVDKFGQVRSDLAVHLGALPD